MEKSGSLTKKLAEVMAQVHRVPKRGRNEFHKYDYATEADIADAVRDGLAQRHIMILPAVTSYELREVPGKNGAKLLTFVSMTFTLSDGESGEREERAWVGAGEDAGDKGIYKAITGAEKYFLLKLFLMSTGDDPEVEDVKPAKAAPARQRPQVQGAITAEQIEAVGVGIKASGLPNGDAIALLKKVAGVESRREIPADKFQAVIEAFANVGVGKGKVA